MSVDVRARVYQLASIFSRTRCNTLKVAAISRSDSPAMHSSRRPCTMARISFNTGRALRPSTITLLRRSVLESVRLTQPSAASRSSSRTMVGPSMPMRLASSTWMSPPSHRERLSSVVHLASLSPIGRRRSLTLLRQARATSPIARPNCSCTSTRSHPPEADTAMALAKKIRCYTTDQYRYCRSLGNAYPARSALRQTAHACRGKAFMKLLRLLWNKPVLAILIVAVLVAGFFFWQKERRPTPEQQYVSEVVERGDITQTVSANGT